MKYLFKDNEINNETIAKSGGFLFELYSFIVPNKIRLSSALHLIPLHQE